VKASILIVGDDPVLLHTRAELLRDWQIVTANSWEAENAILAQTYDLLIFSQTVEEKVVRGLIDQARQLHPEPRILAIRSGEERHLGSPTYQVELNNPGGLRSAVARILDSCPTPAELNTGQCDGHEHSKHVKGGQDTAGGLRAAG
jgi:hypothetical protein